MFMNKNKLMKVFLIILMFSLCVSLPVFAAPSVSNVSGSLNNGAVITVNGLNFGSNGPNIVLFDDFESGINGSNIKIGVGSATIGKWDKIGGGDGSSKPVYSNKYSVSGNLAFRGDYTINTGSGSWDSSSAAFVYDIDTKDVFLSFWYMLPTTSQFPQTNYANWNWKLSWFYNGSSMDDDQVVSVGLPDRSFEPFSSWAISCNNCYGPHANWYTLNMYKGKWYRIWVWIHATNDTTSQKKLWVMGKDDNLVATQKVNWNGRIFNNITSIFNRFSFNAWARWCNPCTESYGFFDDVYLATGPYAQARVEIGNASTYNACTNLSIATVISWSDTQIKATLRQGALNSLSNAYLYVFDANGNVNQNGYPLCPDCPGNPTGLTVQ